MILEMIDGEPPYFSEPPLQAMRKLKDLDPPITQRNDVFSSAVIFAENLGARPSTLGASAFELLNHSFIPSTFNSTSLADMMKRF